MVKAFYGIDLDAIERPTRRLGNKPRVATTRMRLQVARMAVRRLEKQLAREEARGRLKLLSQRPGRKDQIGPLAGHWMLLTRMQPGAWYARSDIGVLMREYKKNSTQAWLYKELGAKGLVEQTDNPEAGSVKGYPRGKAAGKGKYLYRLSSRGEAVREEKLAYLVQLQAQPPCRQGS